MKSIVRIITAAAVSVPVAAWAAETPKAGGLSWMVIAFLAFFAALILFQLVPAIVLFVSMLSAVFVRKSRAAKSSETEAAEPR